MLSGVAVPLSEFPVELIEQHHLHRRVYERGGERELQFHLAESPRILPTWWQGRLQVLRWGTQRGESRVLPCSAWASVGSVEQGKWSNIATTEVTIPGTVALDRGVWFRVREGIRGIAVRDEHGRPVVYPLVEPASHYYRMMTRCEWAPALVGDAI